MISLVLSYQSNLAVGCNFLHFLSIEYAISDIKLHLAINNKGRQSLCGPRDKYFYVFFHVLRYPILNFVYKTLILQRRQNISCKNGNKLLSSEEI